MPSRRDLIRMTDDELRSFLEEQRIVIAATHGRRGWPHVMPLWYIVRGDRLLSWTYEKSQKVRNVERNPRATLLVEDGHTYTEMRGVQIEADTTLHRDDDYCLEFVEELIAKYSDGFESMQGEATDALRQQAAKRTVMEFTPERTVSWDHGKLGGTY